MLIVTNAVIRSCFVLAISTNIADVTCYHSTIAVGESLDPILTNYCRSPVK